MVIVMLAWFIMCQSLVASANTIEPWGQALRGSPNKNSVTAQSTVSEASNVPASAAWGGVAIDYTGTHLFAAQDPGGLYMSSNRGATWQLAQNGIPTNANFEDVACSSSGQYVIALTSTATLLSSNYGASWSTTTVGSAVAVGTSGSGSIIAALKSSSAVQVSSDFGNTFVSIGSPSTASPGDIAVSTNGTIIVVSYWYKGFYTATLIGGTWTWSSATLVSSNNYNPVAYGGGYFYASTGFAIYKSPDGITWSPTGNLPSWSGFGLFYLSAGDSDVIAASAALFYSGDGGNSYVEKSGYYGNVAVSGDNSNGVWISGPSVSQVYYGNFADLPNYVSDDDDPVLMGTISTIIISVTVVCGCCCIGGCVAVYFYVAKRNTDSNNSPNNNQSVVKTSPGPHAPTNNPVHMYSK